MERGYIKLWRKIEDFDWYKNPVVLTLWIHILLNANHTNKPYQGLIIKRGTFKTGLKKLSYETGLSIQQVRTALDKLEVTNNITSNITNKYRIIEVLNYNDYQMNNKLSNNQITIKQQSNNNQITTTNNEKHLNNEKNGNKVIKKKDSEPKIKYLDFVLLTEEEYSKLIKKLETGIIVDSYIERLNGYIGSKGIKYKSHYHTILNWYRKDNKENGNKQTSTSEEELKKRYGED